MDGSSLGGLPLDGVPVQDLDGCPMGWDPLDGASVDDIDGVPLGAAIDDIDGMPRESNMNHDPGVTSPRPDPAVSFVPQWTTAAFLCPECLCLSGRSRLILGQFFKVPQVQIPSESSQSPSVTHLCPFSLRQDGVQVGQGVNTGR